MRYCIKVFPLCLAWVVTKIILKLKNVGRLLFFRSMINHFSPETLAKSQGSDQHILHIDVSFNKIDADTPHSNCMVSSIHRLYRILGYIHHIAHTQQIYETLYTLRIEN